MSRIISYKGKMDDNTQDKIFLATNDGLRGYTINKFQLMPKDPEEDIRSTVKIYSTEQSAISENIDFNQSDLLASQNFILTSPFIPCISAFIFLLSAQAEFKY